MFSTKILHTEKFNDPTGIETVATGFRLHRTSNWASYRSSYQTAEILLCVCNDLLFTLSFGRTPK